MDFISIVVGFIVSLLVLLAILRLFSIDGSLKRVVRQLDDLSAKIPQPTLSERPDPDKCPYCGSNSISRVPNEIGVEVRQCGDCRRKWR